MVFSNSAIDILTKDGKDLGFCRGDMGLEIKLDFDKGFGPQTLENLMLTLANYTRKIWKRHMTCSLFYKTILSNIHKVCLQDCAHIQTHI